MLSGSPLTVRKSIFLEFLQVVFVVGGDESYNSQQVPPQKVRLNVIHKTVPIIKMCFKYQSFFNFPSLLNLLIRVVYLTVHCGKYSKL